MSPRDFGHQAEELLLTALATLGVVEFPRSAVLSKPRCSFGIARATEHEDENDGTDFWFYVRGRGWFRIDLTVANGTEVLNRKKARARRIGVTVVRISGRTLKLAARGSHRDLEVIAEIFESVISEENKL